MSINNQFDIAYPKNENAVSLVFNDNFPIQSLFIGITFPLSTYKILRYNSEQVLLEYILDGEGEIVIDKKKIKLSKGDVFVLTKHSKHDYSSNKNNPLKKIWISFKSDYLDKMMMEYKISSGVYKIEIEKQFTAIYDIANSQITLQNKLFSIADNLHQIITAISRKILSTFDEPISFIKNQLLSSVYSQISLTNIANKLYMSKSNLIRIFKKHTGITPYAFLLNEKLSVSKTLLRSTNMTVKSISELLCFNDEHYFSFLFKQKNGKTPTEYRNN